MDSQEFKVRGRQMVDYIIQYLEVSVVFHIQPIITYGTPAGNRDQACDSWY